MDSSAFQAWSAANTTPGAGLPVDMLDLISQFSAGYADQYTAGMTTRLRAYWYGEQVNDKESQAWQYGQQSAQITQYFTDFALIIVDDASTDDSLDHLMEWSRRDERIYVLQLEENRGPSASRNEAICRAAGEFVVYLDCDDEFYPDYLSLVARLSPRGDVLFFGYDFLGEGGDAPQMRTWNPSPRKSLLFQKIFSTPLGVAHRRSLWEIVGGFNELLWCQEDRDFWRRIARTGAATDIFNLPLRPGHY